MRRFIFTIVLSLLFAPLFGNDGFPKPRLFLKKVYYNLINSLFFGYFLLLFIGE